MSRVPFSCLRDSRHHSRFVLNTMKRQAAEADDFGPGFEEVGAYPEAPAHIIKKARLEALLEQPVHFPGERKHAKSAAAKSGSDAQPTEAAAPDTPAGKAQQQSSAPDLSQYALPSRQPRVRFAADDDAQTAPASRKDAAAKPKREAAAGKAPAEQAAAVPAHPGNGTGADGVGKAGKKKGSRDADTGSQGDAAGPQQVKQLQQAPVKDQTKPSQQQQSDHTAAQTQQQQRKKEKSRRAPHAAEQHDSEQPAKDSQQAGGAQGRQQPAGHQQAEASVSQPQHDTAAATGKSKKADKQAHKQAQAEQPNGKARTGQPAKVVQGQATHTQPHQATAQAAAAGKLSPQPAAAAPVAAAAAPVAASKGSKGNSVLDKMRAKLAGGRFRSLNEQLYTCTGDAAYEMMQSDPSLFEHYHSGFQQQTVSWPQQPLDLAAKWLSSRPDTLVVADFGCGEGRLATIVKQKVHSFDLVSPAPHVIACNMAHVPLTSGSVDVAVFSLALMGTDYGAFLVEAARVLRHKGWLWIAEVRSRFAGEDDTPGPSSTSSAHKAKELDPFFKCLARLGFTVQSLDTSSNTMFFVAVLRKLNVPSGDPDRIAWPALKACVYKKR